MPLLFVEHDDGYVVTATNFDTEHHPGWAYNLEADPMARIEIDGEESAVSARLLDEAEATPLWARFETVWPAYETYQQIAPRDIKMFMLTQVVQRPRGCAVQFANAAPSAASTLSI